MWKFPATSGEGQSVDDQRHDENEQKQESKQHSNGDQQEQARCCGMEWGERPYCHTLC